jgi:hypothetical protein
LSGYNENGNDEVSGLNDHDVTEVPIQRQLRYYLYDDEYMWKRVWNKKVPFFFSNVDPDDEIYPDAAGVAYEQAWGAMQPWLYYDLAIDE